jgi:hypothetical protein
MNKYKWLGFIGLFIVEVVALFYVSGQYFYLEDAQPALVVFDADSIRCGKEGMVFESRAADIRKVVRSSLGACQKYLKRKARKGLVEFYDMGGLSGARVNGEWVIDYRDRISYHRELSAVMMFLFLGLIVFTCFCLRWEMRKQLRKN